MYELKSWTRVGMNMCCCLRALKRPLEEEVSEELCVEKERLPLEKPGVNVFGVQPVWVVGW